MKRLRVCWVISLALASMVNVHADGFALGAKAGTLGPGLDLTARLTDQIHVRVGGNYFPFSYEGKAGDVDYDSDLTLASAVAVLDWHPFHNQFRISGGGIYNKNKLELHAQPTESQQIGDIEYTPEQIGTLTGAVDFTALAPYIGIGFGDAVAGDRRWGFIFDLGVMFTGTPEVSLTANGTLADNPIFQSELAKEQEDIQEQVEVIKFYPVLAFGISYQF